MKFIITKEDAETLLAYIARHPYLEVHNLVRILQNLQPHVEAAPNLTLAKTPSEGPSDATPAA